MQVSHFKKEELANLAFERDAAKARRPSTCAPGRAHLLGGESPLHTRQGEVLADGKGVVGDCESEGSPRQ